MKILHQKCNFSPNFSLLFEKFSGNQFLDPCFDAQFRAFPLDYSSQPHPLPQALVSLLVNHLRSPVCSEKCSTFSFLRESPGRPSAICQPQPVNPNKPRLPCDDMRDDRESGSPPGSPALIPAHFGGISRHLTTGAISRVSG